MITVDIYQGNGGGQIRITHPMLSQTIASFDSCSQI